MGTDKTEVLYKKVGNKYISIGVDIPRNLMGNGIWYVHGNGMTSMSYICNLFHIGDSQVVDLPQLAGLYDYIDIIHKSAGYQAMQDKGSYTLQEMMTLIISEIFKYNQSIVNTNLYQKIDSNMINKYLHHPLFKENLIMTDNHDDYFLPKWLINEMDQRNQTDDN